MDDKLLADLEVEDLLRGWVTEEEQHLCIFCGESFAEGYLYPQGERMMTAKKAAERHVTEVHGGAFQALLNLDKPSNGLSDVQKKTLLGMYEGKANQALAEEMGVTVSTVRTHKFNLQKNLRHAKIFLALMKTVEMNGKDTELSVKLKKNNYLRKIGDDKTGSNGGKGQEIKVKEEKTKLFSLNSLHPFFTQYRLK